MQAGADDGTQQSSNASPQIASERKLHQPWLATSMECYRPAQQQLAPLHRQAAAAHHGTQRIAQLSEEEHKIHLQKVLQTLRENEFYLKPTKCEFFKPELKYLGHIVSAAGIKPDPKKMEIVETWPTPKDAHQLRTFLGLANYFRKFIQGYSKVTVPLTALLKNKAVYTWTTDCQIAFDALKHALITAPVLKAPDFTKDAKGEWLHKFTVIVDASESNMAVGAVLMQGDHVIAYDSKKCTPAEQNYTVTELEMLAVVRALDIWRCYLHGPKFTLVTDHHPNTFFLSQKDIHNKRHAR